jgi:hypothetical protein
MAQDFIPVPVNPPRMKTDQTRIMSEKNASQNRQGIPLAVFWRLLLPGRRYHFVDGRCPITFASARAG